MNQLCESGRETRRQPAIWSSPGAARRPAGPLRFHGRSIHFATLTVTLLLTLFPFRGSTIAHAQGGGSPVELTAENLRLAAEFSAKADGASMLVMQDGRIVFEDYPTDHYPLAGPDQSWFLASGTKSFWGPVAAAMIDDGLIASFDERVSETITEWAGTDKAEITLRQLLSLTSGIDADHGQGVTDYAVAIQSPLLDPPGTRFRYGPTPYQVFGELMRRKLRAAGIGGDKPDPVRDYLLPRILSPIDSQPDDWRYSASGDAHLPSGARFTARQWVQFGELMRQGGLWGEQRIISGSGLNQCVTGSPVRAGYGLTWWLDSSAPGSGGSLIASARGAGKQHLYVSRALGLVVLRQTGRTLPPDPETRSRQDLYDIDDFWSLLLRGRIAGQDRDGDLIANARDAFPDMPDAWLDADEDGLGDRFEHRILGHDPDDDLRNLLHVLPEDDYDGDGASNLEEFLAGTDPTRAPDDRPEPGPDASTIWLPLLARDWVATR